MATLVDGRFTATDPVLNDLRRLLLAHYYKTDTIERILEGVLPRDRIRWNANASDVWPDVLTLAARLRKMQALLERIVAFSDVAVADQFKPFLKQASLACLDVPAGHGVWPGSPPVEHEGQPSVDPYGVAMVGAIPLIDRTELRRFLRQMHQPDGSRVLVVSGSDGCGKSHTWFAISHLAERLGAFSARSVDLSQRAGGPAELDEVMDLVASRLFAGAPAPVGDRMAQDDTRINRFVGWLTSATDSFTRPVWLVFDGFVPECASPSALKLVTAIARAVDRQELPKLRVTVLGFAGRAGPDVLSYALRDTPAHPKTDDLRRFFRTFAERQQTIIDDDGIDVLMAQLVDDQTDLAALGMGELSRRAYDLARAVLEAPDE